VFSGFALIDAAAKQRQCFACASNAQDTDVFSIRARDVFPKDVAIEKLPWITEHDVRLSFRLEQTLAHCFARRSRAPLDTLSVERRGGFLFVFINGRMITELQIDKRVSDGKIYIPSGLTAADVELMKKKWRLLGKQKR
jgi:hypothetical protein